MGLELWFETWIWDLGLGLGLNNFEQKIAVSAFFCSKYHFFIHNEAHCCTKHCTVPVPKASIPGSGHCSSECSGNTRTESRYIKKLVSHDMRQVFTDILTAPCGRQSRDAFYVSFLTASLIYTMHQPRNEDKSQDRVKPLSQRLRGVSGRGHLSRGRPCKGS